MEKKIPSVELEGCLKMIAKLKTDSLSEGIRILSEV